MEPSFSCQRVAHIFTNDLYIEEGKDQEELPVKERISVVEYGKILGPLFQRIGIAFKTVDDKGRISYIDKESFVTYLCKKNKPQLKFTEEVNNQVSKDMSSKSEPLERERLKNIFEGYLKLHKESNENIKNIRDYVITHVENPDDEDLFSQL